MTKRYTEDELEKMLEKVMELCTDHGYVLHADHTYEDGELKGTVEFYGDTIILA